MKLDEQEKLSQVIEPINSYDMFLADLQKELSEEIDRVIIEEIKQKLGKQTDEIK